jgi:hypothetical protein
MSSVGFARVSSGPEADCPPSNAPRGKADTAARHGLGSLWDYLPTHEAEGGHCDPFSAIALHDLLAPKLHRIAVVQLRIAVGPAGLQDVMLGG